VKAAALGWCSLVALLGCGQAAAGVAQQRAERELHCQPPALRVHAIGTLRVLAWPGHPVSLYEASGCEQEQLYVCSDGQTRCERSIADLPEPAAHPALERALELLRTAARARCPESELSVVQESATLFQFAACDGAWLYHCRARGCERLPARAPSLP
jgi:hypothetical protein